MHSVVFICISLLSNELEHLHVCTLVVYFLIPLEAGSVFSGFGNGKVMTGSCQAVPELQIKTLRPKAQTPTPSCGIYTKPKHHAYLGKCWVYFKPAREGKDINSIGRHPFSFTLCLFVTFDICLLISHFASSFV